MGDRTGIEWCRSADGTPGATWNPIVGCSLVSPGCTNCYAMRVAGRLLDRPGSHYEGTTEASKAGPVWTGRVALAPENLLTMPLRWRRPRTIFVNSMGDLFHEDVPDAWIDRVFAVISLTPRHTFIVLTKRARRMRGYFAHDDGYGRWGYIEHHARKIAEIPTGKTLAYWGEKNLPNVWLGVSAEDQQRADERVPLLLDTPAAVRLVSIEPMLGPVDLTNVRAGVHDTFADSGGHPDPAYPKESVGWGRTDALRGEYWATTQTPDGKVWREDEQCGFTLPALDWVIAGGESGPGARPCHPDWARSLRDQCVAAGVPFFWKQWGEFVSVSMVEGDGAFHTFPDGATVRRLGKKKAGNAIDGVIWEQLPDTRRAAA